LKRGGTGRWPLRKAAAGTSTDSEPAGGPDAKKKRQLLELARLYGIQTSYLDMTKQRRDADPEALLLVLRAMGAGVEKLDDVPEALARRKDELRKRTVEPVMVAWDGKLGGRKFEFGYHQTEINNHETFVISAPSKAYYSLPRCWGLFAPIYALHSKRNSNAGDLTDFEHLMDWMSELGGSVAATLPLLGAFLDEPFEPSPYTPATRLFWNEFYIDIERIPEFEGGVSSERPNKTKFVDYRGVMAYKRRILEECARKFFGKAAPQRLEGFDKFVRENKNVDDYAGFRAVTDRQRKGWNAWPAPLRDGKIAAGDYDEDAKNYYLYAQWIIQEQLRVLADKAHARGQLLYLDLPLGLHADSYDVWRYRQFFVRGVAGGAPPDPVFTKGQNWGFPPMNPEAMRLNRYEHVIALLRNHFRYGKLLRIDHVMGLHRLYWIPDGLTGDKGVYVEYPADELYAILCLESHRYQAGIVGENLGTVPPGVNRALARHNIRQMYVVQYEIMGDPRMPKLRPVPARSVASLNTHDMPPFQAFLEGLDIDDRVDLDLLDEKTARRERKQRAVMRKALAAVAAVREAQARQLAVSSREAQARQLAASSREAQARQRAASSNDGRRPPRRPSSADVNGRYVGVLRFLARSMADIVLINLEDLWQETFPQNVPATNKTRPNWRRRIRPSIEQIRRMAAIAEVLSDVFAHRS
jgi:4-alpha-glucanotransferase